MLAGTCAIVDGDVIFARRSCEDAPSGMPTTVLVHGVGVSSRNMVPLAGRLTGEVPVLAPDLPGMGKSSNPASVLDVDGLADRLADWMDVIGLASAAFVANSFGCQVVAALGQRHPERVERAVLQGPTIDPHARSWIRQLLRWLRNGMRERSTQSDVTMKDWMDSGLRTVVITARHSMSDRIEERLPDLQAPTLVVRGHHDPIVPQAWAEAAADMLPRGRLLVMEGAAHTITFNHADRLGDVIVPFLRGQEP